MPPTDEELGERSEALRVLCEYRALAIPALGGEVTFSPLPDLAPVRFVRRVPDEDGAAEDVAPPYVAPPEAAPPAENPNISKSVVVKATDMDAEMVEAAVRAYEDSLMEDRTEDVQRKVKKLQADIAKAAKEAEKAAEAARFKEEEEADSEDEEDTVRAEVGYSRLGNSSAQLDFALFNDACGTALARGHIRQVFVDRESRRSTPIPAALRAAILARQPALADV